MHISSKKLDAQSQMAVCENGKSARLFITDKKTKVRYLIDTGADVSVLPATYKDKQNGAKKFTLFTASGAPLPTYGERLVNLQLGLRRNYHWPFVLTTVSHPIIGADLLKFYNLIVDLRNKKLVDGDTHLSVPTCVTNIHTGTGTALHCVNDTNDFTKMLQEFPEITRPPVFPKERSTHKTMHVIETTGPPVRCRFRRLSPEKLQAAKEEFQLMMNLGICRPSKSNWSSPLHLATKKDGSWRPCGDYRNLNAVTKPATLVLECHRAAQSFFKK